MEAIAYTKDVFYGALDWINGNPSALEENDVKDFISTLSSGFNRRFQILHPLSPVPRTRPLGLKVPSLAAICGEEVSELVLNMERNSEKAEERVNARQEGNASDVLDSVILINSISHLAGQAGGSMTSSRAQMILYCIYGSYLAHNGERLGIEHPQVWKYGPVFPRAYKRGNLGDRGVCNEAFLQLAQERPDVAELVSSKTSSLLYTPMVDLDACHRSEVSPYGKTLRRNPDRWGTQIDDALIAEFFSRSDSVR